MDSGYEIACAGRPAVLAVKGKNLRIAGIARLLNTGLIPGRAADWKHTRQRRQDQQGGIIEQEAAIHVSNLSVVCKRCNRATRIGIDILEDGSKVRFCKKCNEVM